MSIGFNAEQQLGELIRKYPDELRNYGIRVDIYGVILDYLAKSGYSIEHLLSEYQSLYVFLFPTGRQIPDETFILMKAVFIDHQQRSRALATAKRQRWDGLVSLIDQIEKKDKSCKLAQPGSEVDRLAKHRVEGVVWQLSDIHFGSLNFLLKDAQTLANTFGQIIREKPDFTPRFIVISGDVSSSAQENELKEFTKFCKLLSDEVWGEPRPHRILLVPGNHETTWLSNGIADKLENFKKVLADELKVVTPFWLGRTPSYDDSLGRVTIHRYDPDKTEDVPPFVLVHDKALDVRILLLVSSYYSGFVPEKVREVLDKIGENRDRSYLTNLLREDTGDFRDEYISNVERSVWTGSEVSTLGQTTTIAVTHHNLDQYGPEICKNSHAPLLLSTLARREVQLVLHGHTHFEEDLTHRRPATPGQAYPVPCPALCGIPASGSINGFMVHLVGPVGSPRLMTSAVWRINDLGRFDWLKDHLRVRYRFKINKNRIQVRHVQR